MGRRLERSAKPALDVLADALDREQNAIINDRNPQLRLLILDGPAGTGKTAVAAHRIAVAASPQSTGIYFTPTNILRDYIDPVLPQVGLERQRARSWSIAEWARAVWPEFSWCDDLSGMVPDCPWDQNPKGSHSPERFDVGTRLARAAIDVSFKRVSDVLGPTRGLVINGEKSDG